MNCLLCYNPNSGKKKRKKILDYAKTALSKKFEVDEYKSTGPKAITEYIKSLDTQYDLIVACGGDGTVNEVVSGVIESRFPAKIGIIPLGTVNDMIHNLGVKKRYKKAVEALLKFETKTHDIYKANDSYFSYAFAIGFLSSISYKSKSKRLFGPFGYYLSGLVELFKFRHKHVKITVNDKTIEGKYSLVIVTNSNHIAGYSIKKNKDLDLVLFRGTRVTTAFALLLFFVFNKAPHHEKCDSLKIETSFDSFNTDGEYNLLTNTVNITKVRALEFVCDKRYLKDKS